MSNSSCTANTCFSGSHCCSRDGYEPWCCLAGYECGSIANECKGSSSNSGLSAWQLALVIVAVLVLVCIGAFIFWHLRMRRKRNRKFAKNAAKNPVGHATPFSAADWERHLSSLVLTSTFGRNKEVADGVNVREWGLSPSSFSSPRD